MTQNPRLIRLFYGLHSITSLAYQVIWIKILATYLGMSIAALGTVLACFVGGLGLGSFTLARLVQHKKFSIKKIFGFSQIGLAFWVALFPGLLNSVDSIYIAFAPATESILHHVARVGMASVLLLPPSILIGMMFPLLSQVQESWQKKPIGQNAGRLFKDGLLWSALGCLILPALLVPQFGLMWTGIGLALINFSIGGLGFKFLPKSVPAPKTQTRKFSMKKRLPLNALVALGFLLGVALFTVEVIGAKFLWLTVDATVYAEGIIVGVVLIMMALGSLLYFELRKIQIDSMVLLSGGFILFSICVLIWLVFPFELSDMGKTILIGETSSALSFFVSHFVLVLSVLGGPALASGTIFSSLCELATPQSKQAGDAIGQLTGWHYVGSVLGSLLTTFVILPFIGMTGGLAWIGLLTTVIGCALIATLVSKQPIRRLIWALCVLFSTGFLILEKFGDVTFRHVAVPKDQQVLFHHEDGAGLVEVYRDRDFGTRELFSSRLRGEGSDRPEGLVTKTWEGILPVGFHPNPKSVLVVGLGTGISLAGTLQSSAESITVVEYSKGVIQAAELFKRSNQNVLDDPRVRLVQQDGRNFIRLSKEKYDVIIQDLFFPYRAGVGNLYTRDHYENIREHLNSGGRAAQWVALHQIGLDDLKSLIKTFSTVFPDTTLWLNGRFLLLYGGVEELRWDWTQFKLKPIESNPIDFASLYLTRANFMTDWLSLVPLNTDDNAYIEYRTPLLFKDLNTNGVAVRNLKALLPFSRSAQDLFMNVPPVVSSQMSRAQGARDFYVQAYIQKEENASEEVIEKSLASYKLNPSHYQTRRALELTYVERAGLALANNKVPDAKVAIKQALNYFPASRDARFFWAQIKLNEGSVEEGTILFEDLIKDFPDYFLARLHFAKFLCSTGRKKGALEHIRIVLTQVPDHRDALWLAHTCQ